MEIDLETIPAIPLLEAETITQVGEVWTNCTSANDTSIIEKVTISPDPPEVGKNVTVTATVNMKEQVSGGTINVDIHVSFIHIKKTLDLCATLEKAGKTCPIAAGSATTTITQHIPGSPKGHAKGTIKVNDDNGKEIACVEINLEI